MHLKSYQIDGKLLRTGAANFSASGLKRQDNDLIVIERMISSTPAGRWRTRRCCLEYTGVAFEAHGRYHMRGSASGQKTNLGG